MMGSLESSWSKPLQRASGKESANNWESKERSNYAEYMERSVDDVGYRPYSGAGLGYPSDSSPDSSYHYQRYGA